MSIGLTRDEYDEEIAAYEASIKELENLLRIEREGNASLANVLLGFKAANKTLGAENQRLRDALQQLHDIMKMGGFDCPELDAAGALLGGGE